MSTSSWKTAISSAGKSRNKALIFRSFWVVTLSAFRLFGVSRPLLVVAKPLLGRKQWVGEYVRH